MKPLILLLLTFVSLPVYAKDYDWINVQNTRTDDYYVSQLTSKHYPYNSCIPTVAKMMCNVLCETKNESCNKSLTQLSEQFNVNSNGTYLSELEYYFYNETDIKLYSSESDKTLQKLVQGNIVATIVDTHYLPYYEHSFNHAILLVGVEYKDDKFIIYYKDPFLDNKTYSIAYSEYLKASKNGYIVYGKYTTPIKALDMLVY